MCKNGVGVYIKDKEAGTEMRRKHIPTVLVVMLMLMSMEGRAMEKQQVPERTYKWQKIIDPGPFAPRDGAGALVFRNRMWLIGGWNPGDKKFFPKICNNEVWSTEDGKTWERVKRNTFDSTYVPAKDWEGRHTAGYVVFKNKMWIVGGDGNQGHYQNDVWNSEDGKTWTHVNKGNPVPWGPRVLHYTVVFKDRIWVMGGQTLPQFAGGKDEIFYNDVWNTEDGINWTRVETKGPIWSPRGMVGGSVVFKGRIWLLGGGVYDTPKKKERQFFSEIWSTADGINWRKHKDAPWQARQYHEVALFDSKMWVMEGWHYGNRNDVWYSRDGETWHELPGTPWSPRHAASVFVFDNGLWMVAGNNMQSDVWKLTIR